MDNIFKITIGSVPAVTSDTGTLDYMISDRNIIKSALLYADKLYVCSPMGNIINSLHQICSMPKDAKFEDKLKLLDSILTNTSLRPEMAILLSSYTKLQSVKHPSKDWIILKRNLVREINKVWNDFHAGKYDSIGVSSQVANELLHLYKLGLIEYHFFNVTKENLTAELLSQFSETIIESISDPYSYPLLDDMSGLYISNLIKSGIIQIPPSEIKHSKHISLAANLFRRLPNFDLASIDEILDIRNELNPYLVRFRKAMMDLSENINSSQWDDNFEKEAEYTFRKSIEPSIQEIEEDIKSKSYLKLLTSRFAEKPHLFPIPVLGIYAISQISGYDMISSIISSTLLTGANLYEVYSNLKKEKLSIERNQLFFYYKAMDLIGK